MKIYLLHKRKVSVYERKNSGSKYEWIYDFFKNGKLAAMGYVGENGSVVILLGVWV